MGPSPRTGSKPPENGKEAWRESARGKTKDSTLWCVVFVVFVSCCTPQIGCACLFCLFLLVGFLDVQSGGSTWSSYKCYKDGCRTCGGLDLLARGSGGRRWVSSRGFWRVAGARLRRSSCKGPSAQWSRPRRDSGGRGARFFFLLIIIIIIIVIVIVIIIIYIIKGTPQKNILWFLKRGVP